VSKSPWTWVVIIFLSLASAAAFSIRRDSGTEVWQHQILSDLEKIDRGFEGEVGVYIKRLSDSREVHFRSREPWYLASTIKVFVAAHVLSEVDAGRIKLSRRVKLKRSDFVDGSGEVNWKKPGAVMSVGYLLEKMLTQSDSTATDLLIRLSGEKELNQFIQKHLPGYGQVSTILEVRHAAYSEAHPRARRLTNMDFIALKGVPPAQRLGLFTKMIRAKSSEIRVRSLEEAFERYYQRGFNSGSLEQFGLFIERLLTGRILSARHTALLAKHMEAAVTGKERIQAGLPANLRFAQKTGTQIARICNVGLISPPDNGPQVVVTACVRKFKSFEQGQNVFRQIGQSLTRRGAFLH